MADEEERAAALERTENDDISHSMAHLLAETAFGAAHWSVRGCGYLACFDPEADDGEASEQAEREAQAKLLRDIFGNPFRPFLPSPAYSAWLTTTVLGSADVMYKSRDFSAMPILADALQDAGCDNPDILDHCRGPGPHVRGCWVVDLLLGKE